MSALVRVTVYREYGVPEVAVFLEPLWSMDLPEVDEGGGMYSVVLPCVKDRNRGVGPLCYTMEAIAELSEDPTSST